MKTLTELEALKVFKKHITNSIIEFRKNKTGQLRDFEKGCMYTLMCLERQLGMAELELLRRQSPNISELMTKIKKANMGVN